MAVNQDDRRRKILRLGTSGFRHASQRIEGATCETLPTGERVQENTKYTTPTAYVWKNRRCPTYTVACDAPETRNFHDLPLSGARHPGGCCLCRDGKWWLARVCARTARRRAQGAVGDGLSAAESFQLVGTRCLSLIAAERGHS